MKSSALTLLPNTTFGTPSENYDGSATEFAGIPVKAASYYLRGKSLQTVSWIADESPIMALDAKVYIEGTMETDSDTENWITIYTISDDSSTLSTNGVVNIEGNFTWIRVRVVDFASGGITRIVLSY